MNLDNIELRYQENIRPDSKWQFDQIDAYMGEQHLGYIRVAYINADTIKTWQNDPLFLAYDVLHKSQLYNENYQRNGDVFTKTHIPKYYEQAKYTALLLYPKDLKTHWDEIENWNDEQLQEYVSKHTTQIFKALFKEERLKQYAEYHFCRPDIDYIQVFEPFQKNGVGTLLYRAASKWVNEKGMVLHSSTLQQEGAVRSWEKMKGNGEADVLHIKGHKHPRYRYVKDVNPKWLSNKIIFAPQSIARHKKPTPSKV